MKTKTPRVRIVLPAYNEEDSLGRALAQVHRFCTTRLIPYDWHLFLINNGSFDSTGAQALRLAREYQRVTAMHLKKAGRGGALREAASLPDADYLMYMDVDLSTELEAIPRMLEALDHGADVAVGSRHHPASQISRGLYREALSRTYNLMLRSLFRIKTFRDAQCGFKAFRLVRLRPLMERVRDRKWFFDTELLVLAEYSGLKVVEIPVQWKDNTSSKVHTPTVIAQYLYGMIRLKLALRRSYQP